MRTDVFSKSPEPPITPDPEPIPPRDPEPEPGSDPDVNPGIPSPEPRPDVLTPPIVQPVPI
jgi:hypothetical protein